MVHFPENIFSEAFSWLPERLTDVSSWHGHIPFAFAFIQLARPGLFVELGTHKGDSYCAFCQAIKNIGMNCSSFAVDSWEGDEHSGYYGSEVLTELKNHHDPRYGKFSTLLQMRFDEAVTRFDNDTIDILHIDGLHSYDAVKHDYETWLPKMSQKGIIIFHDTHVTDDEFGVWRLWNEVKREYPYFEFAHSNGLGILGVGKEIAADLLDFFSLKSESSRIISNIFQVLGQRIVYLTQIVGMERRLDNFQQELTSCHRFIGDLQNQIQEKDNELENRQSYIRKLEDRFENTAAENLNKAKYISELEHRVEDVHHHYQQRGDYILEIESHLVREREEKENYISANNQLSEELRKYETSVVCKSWIEIVIFIKDKLRLFSKIIHKIE